jgi:phage terminase small subunit
VDQIERRKRLAELNLQKKEMTFCLSYLQNYDPKKAALDAGYKPVDKALQQGKLVLAKPRIQEALKLLEAEIADRVELKDEDIIRELMFIGFSNICKALQLRKVGRGKAATLAIEPKDLMALPEGVQRAIQEVSIIKSGATTTTKIKFHPKTQVLEMMLNHRGLNRPQKEPPEPGDPRSVINIKNSRVLLADPAMRKVLEDLSSATGDNKLLQLLPKHKESLDRLIKKSKEPRVEVLDPETD